MQDTAQATPQYSAFRRFISQKLGLGDPQRQADENAYRQQVALEHYRNRQDQEETKALEWADKAFEAEKLLSEAQTALALQPKGSPLLPGLEAKVASRERYLQFTIDAAKRYDSGAVALQEQIPQMMAGMTVPSQGGGEGAPQIPTMPSSDMSYERPAMAAAGESSPGAPPTPAMIPNRFIPGESNVGMGGAEPGATPEPAADVATRGEEEAPLTQGTAPVDEQGISTDEWGQLLRASGMPKNGVPDESGLWTYSVPTQQDADRFNKTIDELQKSLPPGVIVPAKVVAREPIYKFSIEEADKLTRSANSLRGRAAMYEAAQQTPADKQKMLDALGQPGATASEAQAYLAATKLSEDKRVAFLKGIQTDLEDQAMIDEKRAAIHERARAAYDQDILSGALRAAGMEQAPAVAGREPAPNKITEDQAFVDQFIKDMKWTRPLTPSQRTLLNSALNERAR